MIPRGEPVVIHCSKLTYLPMINNVGRTVDFDITSAVLNPVYASPSNENAPFEIILEENHNSHIIRFVNREDLFMFQQALTGFQVVDDYAECEASPFRRYEYTILSLS